MALDSTSRPRGAKGSASSAWANASRRSAENSTSIPTRARALGSRSECRSIHQSLPLSWYSRTTFVRIRFPTVSGVRGTRGISVKVPPRTPDPPAGQRLPLPDVQGFILRTANARRDLLARSCPNGRRYENNPWQDDIVDALRALDTR